MTELDIPEGEVDRWTVWEMGEDECVWDSSVFVED